MTTNAKKDSCSVIGAVFGFGCNFDQEITGNIFLGCVIAAVISSDFEILYKNQLARICKIHSNNQTNSPVDFILQFCNYKWRVSTNFIETTEAQDKSVIHFSFFKSQNDLATTAAKLGKHQKQSQVRKKDVAQCVWR